MRAANYLCATGNCRNMAASPGVMASKGDLRQETTPMNRALIKGTIGVATAATIALTAVAPATAAPVLSNTAAVKAAAEPATTDVRWGWGWGWGGALAAGIIGGLAIGALASAPYYGYGYGYPAYGYGYGYGPYYASGPYFSYGYAPYGYYSPGYGAGYYTVPRYARSYYAPRRYAYRNRRYAYR
jgi:hypothetical protein